MSDIEGKAVTGNSERAWVANEFQSRKLKAKLALASVQLVTLPDQCIHDVPVLGLLHRSMILVRSLRRAMPKSIREDSERGVVVIDGGEISGWLDTERCCSQCGSVRVYHDAFDAFFCPSCNLWLEAICGDSSCEYCRRRPEHPMRP